MADLNEQHPKKIEEITPPEAITAIEALESSHSQLIQSAWNACQKPTTKNIVEVNLAATTVIGSIDPFYQKNFFIEEESGLAVEASVKSFLRLMAELAEHTNRLQSGKYNLIIEPDTEANLINVFRTSLEPDEDEEMDVELADAQAEQLCSNYTEGINFFLEAFCESEKVAKFFKRQERLEAMKDNIGFMGKIAVGTALGYSLVKVGEYLVDKF